MNLLYTVIVPHPPLIVPSVGKGESSKIWKTSKTVKKATPIETIHRLSVIAKQFLLHVYEGNLQTQGRRKIFFAAPSAFMLYSPMILTSTLLSRLPSNSK